MINGFITSQKMSHSFINSLFINSWVIFLFVTLLLPPLVWANASNESDLPMSQFNFQGYVPDSKQSRRKEDDPNLIRIHVAPDLYWVLGQILDSYQLQQASTFRIHQGKDTDHTNLISDGYVFDLIVSNEMDYLQSLQRKNTISEIQVLALGRLGLWAPRETVRSTSVVTLQTGAIGLMPEDSVYHRAALEVLERNNIKTQVQKRLKSITVFQDLYALIDTNEIPLGFLPWNRLVQAGIEQRRDVLKINSDHHGVIVHGIALTKQGGNRNDVKDLWRYINGSKGKAIFKAAGFD